MDGSYLILTGSSLNLLCWGISAMSGYVCCVRVWLLCQGMSLASRYVLCLGMCCGMLPSPLSL